MRLIDADRLYNTIVDEIDPISISMDGGEMRGMMRTIIAAEPTVETVPLDKLCDWLAARYEPPMKLDDIEFLGSPYEPEAEEYRRTVWLRELRDWMQKEGLIE